MMRINTALAIRFFSLLCGLAGVSFFIATCKYPNEPVKGNTIPETRLANIPANDTLARYINLNAFPELSLSWIGDDPDGYIIGYRFQWTDYIRGQQTGSTGWTTILNISRLGWENVIAVRGTPASLFNIYNFLVTLGPTDTSVVRLIGDSLFTRRPFLVPYKTGAVATDSLIGLDRLVLQTPTTGTFIFYSPVDSNFHRFEVASIDNKDALDPTPAVVNLWTLVSPGNVVLIDSIPPANSLAIRYATDTWRGLRFRLRSLDPNNTQNLTFSWSVDDTVNWSPWSPDDFANVAALSFKPIASGTHTYYARARNRWGVISPTISRQFTAVIPDFDDPNFPRRILVINGTPHPTTPSVTWPVDTNDSRRFYSAVLDSIGKADKYKILNLAPAPNSRFPVDVELGKYSLVIYLQDAFKFPPVGAGAAYKLTGPMQSALQRYMDVGGKLIIGGIADVKFSIVNYATSQFAINYLHVLPELTTQNDGRDFIGATGRLGYPTMLLDSARIPNAADSGAALRYISVSFPRNFAQSISTFNSRTPGSPFQGLPVGVRFLAAPPTPPARQSYSIVYFGFPLYYGKESSVIQGLRQAVRDVNE